MYRRASGETKPGDMPADGGKVREARQAGETANQIPECTGAFARKGVKAMQAGLPCRVRSFVSAGRSPE